MKFIILIFIRVYQSLISPLFPPTCRFDPSCSEYTKQAVTKYGALQGILMGWRRIKKCHPKGGSGYDPLP